MEISLNGPEHSSIKKETNSICIFLHGWGSDGQDLITLADQFSNEFPYMSFYSPHAPEVCSMNPYGRQWFEISNSLQNIKDIGESVSALNKFIDKIIKINNILERNFNRFKDYISPSSAYKITSDSKLVKSTTSKDSSGNVLTYKLEIIIKLKIFENNNLISEISFSEKTDYNNTTSKFELKQYEDILIQDLTNQLVDQINYHLSTLK